MRRATLILFFLVALAGLFGVMWMLRPAGHRETVGQSPPESSTFPEAPDAHGVARETAGGVARAEASSDAAGGESAARPPGALEDEFTVSFTSRESLEAFAGAAQGRGIRIIQTIEGVLALRIAGHPDSVRDLLSGDERLDYNFRVETPPVPDPVIASREGLRGFGAGSLRFLGIADPLAIADWGRGVAVAVLDTAFEAHPALAGADIRSVDLTDGDVGAVGDGMSGHSTAVASLIVGRDSLVPGLAPASSLTIYGVLGPDGTGDAFSLAAGLVRAVDDGARVINLSLGSNGDSQVLRDAVDYALSRGVVLVASAGNDGASAVSWPAAYEGVLAVGAVDANGRYPSFSNRGEALDLSAPGVGVNTAWSDGAYVVFDGTSSAAPFVTAAAAALLSEDPTLDATAIAGILRDFSNDAGPAGRDPLYGAGVLNMERVEARDQPGIRDLAVADFFFSGGSAGSGAIALQVSYQNRGTEFATGGSLMVEVDGVRSTFALAPLAPNASGSVAIPVSGEALTGPDGISIEAELRPIGGPDARPANDRRSAQMQLIFPEP